MTHGTGTRPRPDGRPPAVSHAVLVRRRLTVLAALATVVLVVVFGVRGVLGSGSAAPLPGEKTTPPEPAAVVAGPPQHCVARDVGLEISTATTSVQVGKPVMFTVVITRAGSRPCLLDGSDAGRAVTITSGTDRVWSSADCPGDERMLLMGRGDRDQTTVTWNGSRSAAGCPGGQPVATPGVYTVVVALAGVEGAVSAPLTVTVTAPPAPTPDPSATTTAPAAGTTPTTTPPAATTPPPAATDPAKP